MYIPAVGAQKMVVTNIKIGLKTKKLACTLKPAYLLTVENPQRMEFKNVGFFTPPFYCNF